MKIDNGFRLVRVEELEQIKAAIASAITIVIDAPETLHATADSYVDDVGKCLACATELKASEDALSQMIESLS